MVSSSSSSNETLIYHERQEALLCGQHALNNLIQTQTFTPQSLSEIAQQLDQMELNYMSAGNQNGIHSRDYLQRVAEGSGNVDESGNFSIEVLRSALMTTFELTLVNTLQENIRNVEITSFDGFICNRASHWFAIRKINERFWNLNSTSERPVLISHFRLAAEIEMLQSSGYSVFVVVEIGRLPKPAMSEEEADARGSGMNSSWWREKDLLKGNGTTIGPHVNHWKRENVGNGMRLDGKSTNAATVETAIPVAKSIIDFDSMTEDEILQFALQQSVQLQQEQESKKSPEEDIELSPEPAPNADGAVRIQFRLPDGKRSERRFINTESTKVLKSYVAQCCPNQSKSTLELRVGFPPKLVPFDEYTTIGSANLSGEQIQCRYV